MEWPAHLPLVGGGGVSLCTDICSITQIQSISLQNINNNNTCTMLGESYSAPVSGVPVLGKKFLKHKNNELNELSECMLYKVFWFFGKYLKTVKLSFTIYFPVALLAYFKVSKTLCTCLLLKVYKTFLKSLAFLLYLALL